MTIPNTVTQLIQSSGNNFHAKVARWFVDNGWHAVISPYYMDQTQAKAREIDLVVEKLWPIKDLFGTPHGDVLVRLFVECKFVPTEAVFWFASKNMTSAENLVCSQGPYRANNPYTNKHHYIAAGSSVAKLFASNNSKTIETEPFYKALNQVLNATVAMRGQSPSHPQISGRRRGQLVILDFPVVVCSSFSSMYGVDFLRDTPPEPISDNFQLEVEYAFFDRSGNHRNDYFLLDFVEYAQLDKFTANIDTDAKSAAYMSDRS